jgi:hypothetical protein
MLTYVPQVEFEPTTQMSVLEKIVHATDHSAASLTACCQSSPQECNADGHTGIPTVLPFITAFSELGLARDSNREPSR